MVPSILMWGILLITYSNTFNIRELDLKGLFIVNLILVFPLLFLIQGILTVILRNNPFVDYLVSTMVYLIAAGRYLNSSAYGYAIYFGVFYLVGYGITKVVIKRKQRVV